MNPTDDPDLIKTTLTSLYRVNYTLKFLEHYKGGFRHF